jgi:hypothetical protein
LKISCIYNLYRQEGGENPWFESEPDMFRARGREVTVYRRDNNELRQRPIWRNAALLWQASWPARSYREMPVLMPTTFPIGWKQTI